MINIFDREYFLDGSAQVLRMIEDMCNYFEGCEALKEGAEDLLYIIADLENNEIAHLERCWKL